MTDEPRPEAHRRTEEPAAQEEGVETDLERGAAGDDAERLKVLEELYKTLESELEGDIDQEESPGH